MSEDVDLIGGMSQPVARHPKSMRHLIARPAPATAEGNEHHGSCRVFYAELRCTCGVAPVAAEGTDELREALAADIAHHVNPAIGWWRSADAQGETFDRTLLTDRYQRAADALIAQRIAPLLAKVQAVEEITADLERTFAGSNIPVRLRRALEARRWPCNYGHSEADHEAAGACVRPGLDAR